jgi:hypothetical protein
VGCLDTNVSFWLKVVPMLNAIPDTRVGLPTVVECAVSPLIQGNHVRVAQANDASLGQPAGNPAPPLDLPGVDAHAVFDFRLFVWITKPTASANDRDRHRPTPCAKI